MTTTDHVLVTGVSLPACCCPQCHSSAVNCPTLPSSSLLLLAQVLRVDSRAGLSYVAWTCTSSSTPSTPSDTPQQQNKLHSQWILQRHVSIVCLASPDANAALDRSLHDSKFEVDNPLVELWSSKCGSMGRFTVAEQCIPMGKRAFQATAFAVVVRQKMAPRRCHWCFAGLHGRKKVLQCGDCEFVRYCSRACLAADATLHDFQCLALRELKRRGCEGGLGNVETVRLALAVLSMEQFVRNPQALRLLVVHREDDDEKGEAQNAAGFIVEMTGRVLDRKHVEATLERVRCNAHPLYLDGVTCVGSGVFPEAAMALNHSCLPNVAPSFNPRTRTLAFHAIAEIPRGHAVECAYIDLLQTTKSRQSLLKRGFGFDCVCERCTNEAVLLEKERDPAAQNEEEDQEETRVMEELMQLLDSNCSDVKQRLSRLKKERADMFKRNSEAQFALFTAEMQLARARGDWIRVIEVAEMLLAIWTRCGLPDNYHTTETLHMQIYLAAKHAGVTEKAKASAQRVASIREICGYSYPETPIG